MVWLARRVPAGQVRDPQAATKQAKFSLGSVMRGAARYTDGFNEAELEYLYMNVYLYACARAIAQDLSSLPLRVGADPDKPKDFDRNHPLARLLGPAPGGPTLNISSRRLIAWSIVQYDLTGQLAWEIAKPTSGRTDVPFELWPIPSSRVKPKDGEGSNWWSYYEIATKGGNIRRNLDQMLYLWRPAQDDFRRPESLIEAAGINVRIATMQDRYDHAFLVNDARPSFMVVHEEFARKSERKSFRRQFEDRHRGPDNANKVAFVEATRDGASPKDSVFIQQLGLSQRDAEFIERYENQIRAVCVAMATPLSRLADSSRRTYSNAERETKNYWRNRVKPAGVELTEGINTSLMPLIGDNSNVAWFDTTGVPELEPAPRFMVGEIPALIDKKIITPNEGRIRVDLPEVKGGNNDVLGGDGTAPVAPPPGGGGPVELSADREQVLIRELQAQFDDEVQDQAGRVIRALSQRAAGKRGRQAALNGASVASLFDLGFWYGDFTDTFSDFARRVLSTAYAADRTSIVPGSAEARSWTDRWSGMLAQRWADNIEQQLEQYIEWDGNIVVRQVEEYDDIVPQMWRTARQGLVLTADEVARAAVRLASGRADLAEVLAGFD